MTSRRHGFGGSPRSSALRRLTTWSVGPHTGAVPGAPQTISTSSTTLATVGVAAAVPGLTLIRVRGVLTFQLQSAAASGNGFVGAFGILNIGGEAFTAGAGSMPDPQDDAGDERWLYHTWFMVASMATAAIEIGKDNLASLRIEVDSKAMRKAPADVTLAAVLGTVEIGTATMEWMFTSRVLDKLP